MEFTFTLKYRLPADACALDELLERLGAHGCDDALVGTGVAGRMALEFTREASSAEEAVCSALADVRRALPAAQLIEAAPDLVGLSDVAGMLKLSRQNLRKLMTTHGERFPAPVHEGSASVWHLAELFEWLDERGYAVDAGALAIARVTRQVNVAKESLRLPAIPGKRLLSLVA
jgi:predicted DNA-binding transcriptional regulator AlpA